MRGVGVMGDVVEGLLGDAIQDGAAAGVELFDGGIRGDGDGDVVVFGELLGVGQEGGDDAEVIEHGGAEVAGEAVDGLNRLFDESMGGF